jgi:hypothetical protein
MAHRVRRVLDVRVNCQFSGQFIGEARTRASSSGERLRIHKLVGSACDLVMMVSWREPGWRGRNPK